MLALTQSGVEIKETVQYMAAYALTYLALMALAIERFKVALLVAYLIWLVSAAASVLLNSLYADPWLKLMTIVGLSAIATTGELVLVRKMSVDRAMARDDRKLDRIHRAAVSSQRELEQIRDAKPKDPRAKHVAKASFLLTTASYLLRLPTYYGFLLTMASYFLRLPTCYGFLLATASYFLRLPTKASSYLPRPEAHHLTRAALTASPYMHAHAPPCTRR